MDSLNHSLTQHNKSVLSESLSVSVSVSGCGVGNNYLHIPADSFFSGCYKLLLLLTCACLSLSLSLSLGQETAKLDGNFECLKQQKTKHKSKKKRCRNQNLLQRSTPLSLRPKLLYHGGW